MDGSMRKGCLHSHWWDSRRPRGRHVAQREDTDVPLHLPLPSFPGPLDFDPSSFSLPPPYEDVVDVEKAVFPCRTSRISVIDASSICQLDKPEPYHYRTHAETELPPRSKYAIRIIRYIRYRFLSAYRRLFSTIFLLNTVGLFILLRQIHTRGTIVLSTLSTLASSNFLLAIIVRQDYLINFLFRSAWLVPWSAPLCLRRFAARIYCYGGIHSGAAIAGTLWWLTLTIFMCQSFISRMHYTLALLTTPWLISMLLLVIIFHALPRLRKRCHDTFELTHRFLGWLSILLFWIQVLLMANYTSKNSPPQTVSSVLLRDPTFYILWTITLLLVYPWLRLCRWTFTAQLLSPHAIRLSFPNPVHKFSCLSVSSSPLTEWHPFATFPSSNGTPGGSMVISSAGDWTRTLIRHIERESDFASRTSPPRPSLEKEVQITKAATSPSVKLTFYVKPHPKAGVLSLSLLFPRVLILTTGSGIGPSLSSLLDRPASQHARLVWSTRSPLATYGAEILALVEQVDRDAVVIDTDQMGRPDLLEVAWGVYVKEKMDAVFVLSNERVVRWVVGGLEARGVPAYGPIWDS